MGQTVGTQCRDQVDAAENPPLRLAALVQRGRRGQRVLAEVLAAAQTRAVEVTLVAVVAHATGRGCAVSPGALNDAIDEAATADLDSAAMWLPLSVAVVDRCVLRRGVDAPLAQWVTQRGFDLVLLPGRRWWSGRGGHGLDGVTGVNVRVI